MLTGVGEYRDAYVASGSVTISDLAIDDGHATWGGGAYNQDGTLAVSTAVVASMVADL